MNRVGIHAVREALRAGAPLRYLVVSRERRDARVQEIVELARRAGVAVRLEPAAALDRLAGGDAHHQGVIAVGEAKAAIALEDVLADAPHRLLLACDSIEDPHNLGAILRSACAAGADAVLLPDRRSVGLTETVERVSAGALEHLRVARVGNLVQALEKCKQAGWWIVGLAADADARPTLLWDYDFSTPTLLVVGAEGSGLHALTRKRCDTLVAIPLAAGVASLNASVAAALALFEVARQRREHQ